MKEEELQIAKCKLQNANWQHRPSARRARCGFNLQFAICNLQFAFLFFFLPQPALAADPSFPRGAGLYFSLFKLIPLLLVYLAWVRTCWWVDTDARALKLPAEVWNPTLFFCGLAGL